MYTQETLVGKTKGKREITDLRDSSIPTSGVQLRKTPRGGGGGDDPRAVQAVFQAMQRRMDEMEQQLKDQGKTQQDQNAQIPQHLPATSGVDPTVRPPPVILPPTRLPVHGQIPEFTGEMVGPTGVMSIEVYLKRIDDNTVGRHWTDEHRILLARKKLSGSALTRLNNRGMYDAENWDNSKKQMRETFTIREEMRESAWHNYQPIRKNGESVSALVDRIANDLDNFTEDGTMPEKQKLKEVKRVLVRVLPQQLHCGIGSSVDTLPKLMQKLEIRACRQPDLKLALPDISSEKLDEVWKNSTQNSTINAVSTATTAPPAAATATASADPATVNATPPPQQTVAATTASNTKPKEEDSDQQSRARDNSYRSKKRDKRKPQKGQQQHQRQHQQQQQQRGRGNDNRIGACHTCGRMDHRRQECHYSGMEWNKFFGPKAQHWDR